MNKGYSLKSPQNTLEVPFKARKGPDFISRLRGFLNVKGPNPVPDAATDPAYMLRRAILLRSEIDKSFPLLKDQTTGQARIAPNLLNALLTVRSYHHGARSLIALLSMSTLGGTRAFTTSALPSRPLLSLHVSDDFGVNDGDPFWSVSLHEALARAGFEAWRAGKTDNPDPAKRYIYGPDCNDDPAKGPLTHKLIKEWDALTAAEKSSNYDPVWRRLIAIQHLGWRIVSDNGTTPTLALAERDELMQALLVPEHNIWLADHLCTGYELHETTRDALRRHTDIKPFAALHAGQQQLNVNIMTATLLAIEKAGYRLIHDDPTTPTVPLTLAITHTSA